MRRSSVLTISRLLRTFDSKIRPTGMEKAINYNILSVLQEMKGRGENSIHVSIWNILSMQWIFGGPLKNYFFSPSFSSFSCGPLESWCGPPEDNTAHFENHWIRIRQLLCDLQKLDSMKWRSDCATCACTLTVPRVPVHCTSSSVWRSREGKWQSFDMVFKIYISDSLQNSMYIALYVCLLYIIVTTTRRLPTENQI